jgi:hypothetical protein
MPAFAKNKAKFSLAGSILGNINNNTEKNIKLVYQY